MDSGASVMSSRTLLLMRHAKSAWPVGVADAQRPLSERGRRDAPEAGRWIASAIGQPDLTVVSPAVRTRQTADLAISMFTDVPDVTYDDRIYEAHWTALAAVISGLPDEAANVVIIGHNPGLEELADHWPQSVSNDAREVLSHKFPTSAIAVVEVTGSWVEPTSSHLRQIVIPRG